MILFTSSFFLSLDLDFCVFRKKIIVLDKGVTETEKPWVFAKVMNSKSRIGYLSFWSCLEY